MTRLPVSFLDRPLAHRGLHDVRDDRPENSRAAIRAAIAHGYGLEIDLQLSRDGQAMVFHDHDLERLTGQRGRLRDRSRDDLARIQLLGGSEGVPDLAEVLRLVDGQVPLLIELKDQDGVMGPRIGTLEAATIAALDGYNGPVALMSFNPHSVAACVKAAPHIACGIVTSGYDYEEWHPLPRQVCDRLRDIPDFAPSGASFISHDIKDLHRPRVAEIKQGGAPVLCWTVRTPEGEAAARRIADNITFEGYLPTFPA